MSTALRSARKKSSRTAAVGGASSTSQETTSKKKVEIVLPTPSRCCLHKDAEIQQLRDDLEEAVHDKQQLQARLEQLEERVDYKETSARIAAAMLDNEKMELRENARKLGVQLSAATHERDTFKHEKEALVAQLANSEDERNVLSTQLTDAWRRIPRLRKDYADVLSRLSTTEKEAEKLKEDLEKAVEQASATKAAYEDDKAKWERDRRDLAGEVASLKEKLVSSSSDGGKQMMDFEKDMARIRGHHKADREKWDAEKRRFLDQIASFRVKLTSLSVQQPKAAPPPEWLLEKQGLEDKCADLTSKLTAAEQTTAPYTKADAERLAKLEAKNAALKIKLKEVLDHATTVQAEADQFRSKLGKKGAPGQGGGGRSGAAGRRGGAVAAGGSGGARGGRGKKASASAMSDSESLSEAGTDDEKGTVSPTPPPPRAPRPVRAKRQAAEKKITSALESSSESSSSSDLDDDSDDDSVSSEDDEESVHANETHDNAQAEADVSIDMDEPVAPTGDETALTNIATEAPSTDKADGSEDTHMEDSQETLAVDSAPRTPTTTAKTTRGSSRASSGRASRKAADDSDSEFEPPVKVSKPRGKGRTKAAAAATKQGDNAKPITIAGSKRPSESDSTLTPSTDAPPPTIAVVSPSTPVSQNVADTATSLSVKGLGSSATAIDPESSSPGSATPKGDAMQEPDTTSSTVIKVKKKRRLLGKGLEDYSSIIQGPKIPGSPSTNHIASLLPSIAASLSAKSSGASGSSNGSLGSPSTPSSARSTPTLGGAVGIGVEKTLGGTSRRNPANKEALNAIKLTFSVPKAARKPSEE